MPFRDAIIHRATPRDMCKKARDASGWAWVLRFAKPSFLVIMYVYDGPKSHLRCLLPRSDVLLTRYSTNDNETPKEIAYGNISIAWQGRMGR